MMAKWVTFQNDWDYTHPSRAMTAYKLGMTLQLPDDIAAAAIDAKAASASKRPADVDGRLYVTDKPATDG